jgi:DUF1707 SHOCT-like domain
MTNQYFFARISGRDLNLRAGDEDRERIADRLRNGHAEGRLDTAELQQRLERCYEAKTFGELGELVSDLPRSDEPAERRPVGWPLSPWHWGLGRIAPLLIVLFVLAALGSHHLFLFWIPLLFIFWRVSLRRRRWSATARRGPDDWI